MKRLAISFILFLTLAPSASAIEVWDDASQKTGIYIQDAQRFWETRGGTTDCKRIRTQWRNTAPALAVAGIGTCDIAYDPKVWHDATPAERDCITLHEYGHAALGLFHVFGRPHIMNPTLYLHPHCRRLFRAPWWARPWR